MATLQSKDFKKTASSGKYAGNTRHQIILEKIKSQDQFTIGKTTAGKKIYGVSLDAKTWPYRLSYSDKPGGDAEGKLISITKLWKDPDFGGGAGSGGGAKETSFTESGQCYYTSLIFNIIEGKELKQKDCTPENLKRAAAYVDATISITDFLENGPQDWIDSDIYRRTANLIYSKYKTKFKGKVYCHRGSKFMDNIYKAKKSVMQSDKFSAPGSFSNDKWNPGDIWLSSLPPKSQPLNESTTWAELNQKVLDLAGALKGQTKTSLLGVSLKKLAGPGKIDWYNAAERKHNVSVKFKGFRFGKTGDFFSSMDIYLQFDVAEVQLRAFNTTSAWQGEIKGLAAAGGKIGGGNLNYYLGKHANKSIGYPGNNRATAEWKEMPANQVDFNKMYELYSQMNGLQTGVGKKFPPVSFDEFVARTKAKGNGFIFSKNMCLMFIQNFLAVKQEIRNNISTEIVRYAASNTDISSFYIKVY